MSRIDRPALLLLLLVTASTAAAQVENPETPVGFTAIRILVDIEADAPADRLERLVQRAEKYCVIASTLRTPPSVELKVRTGQ